MISTQMIENLIQTALTGAQVEARDTRGTNDHFQVKVVANAFEGKNMVERHRMVYAILGSSVGAEIHALSLKTLTPSEAEKSNTF